MPSRPPLLLLLFLISPCFALDFLFDSFNATNPGVILIPDARVDTSVIRLLNDTNQYSLGRAFYPTRMKMKQTQNSTTTLSSFSTSFIFSILPNIASSPGFGLAFVLSNWTNPPGALASQYFGVFSNPTVPSVAPLLVVEFHTGQNPQSNHPNRNHIGIDLNNIESAKTAPGGYNSSAGGKAVEAADERMKGEFEVEEMEMVLKLGLVCCHPDPQRRPSMREVVAVLVGEDVAAAPAELLNVLASGDGGGDGSARGGERGGSNTT
ncbi:L-type lectin-domain containing receptor kinase S.1-like [Populus alba x Populus x berolinensis]|nr:L-type lectin-domain containing receptor kinase S.1-like [Populus alba x Populus x berolinensis]